MTDIGKTMEQLKPQRQKRREQRIERLGHLHSDCEMNYLRLQKIIGVTTGLTRVYQIGTTAEIEAEFEVTRESAYTRMLILHGHIRTLPWAGNQKMAVRIYDDASMAEVVSIDRQRVRMLNYDYPNNDMYVPDEKNQLNQFLSVWLKRILSEGFPIEQVSILS